MVNERRKWFRDRVAKRVFRNDNGCSFSVCANVALNGLVIENEMHSDYLYDSECDYTAEGYPLRYFDTPEEAQEFKIKKLQGKQ